MQPEPMAANASPRGRVLLVDDDGAVARGIARILRRGHDVVVVDSAQAARDLLARDEAFDVVLTDLSMPGFSGIDLYSWIEASHPDLRDRVAFMTGGMVDQDVHAFVEDVARPCFEKPMEPRPFREAVGGMVAASRRARPAGA